jgi:excisionase family DNA binding protein
MRIITIEEAATLLHMSTEGLRRKAQRGEIPGRNTGRRWIFDRERLIAWVNECPSTAEEPSGTFSTPLQMETEYSRALAPPTARKRKNSTTG